MLALPIRIRHQIHERLAHRGRVTVAVALFPISLLVSSVLLLFLLPVSFLLFVLVSQSRLSPSLSFSFVHVGALLRRMGTSSSSSLPCRINQIPWVHPGEARQNVSLLKTHTRC